MNKQIFKAIKKMEKTEMVKYRLVFDIGNTKTFIGLSKKNYEIIESVLPSSILIKYPNSFRSENGFDIKEVFEIIRDNTELIPCVNLTSFQEIQNHGEEGYGLTKIESWKSDFIHKGAVMCSLDVMFGEEKHSFDIEVKIEEIYGEIYEKILDVIKTLEIEKNDLIIGFSVPNYSNDVMERIRKNFEFHRESFSFNIFPEIKCLSFYNILKENNGKNFATDHYHIIIKTGGHLTDIILAGVNEDNFNVLRSESIGFGGTHQTNELVSVVSKEIFEKFKIKLDVNNREIFKDVEDFKIHYIIQEKGKISKGKKKCFFKFIENKCQKTPNESFVEIEHEKIRNCLSMGADVVAKEVNEYIKYVDEMNKNRFPFISGVKIYFCGGNFNNSIYRDVVKAKLNLAKNIKTYTDPKQIMKGVHLLTKLIQFGKYCSKGLKYNEVEFKVEAIVGSKLVNGIKKYLVKWKYYPNKFNSWEPEKKISREIIEKYKKGKLKPVKSGVEEEPKINYVEKNNKRSRNNDENSNEDKPESKKKKNNQ